MPAPATGGCLHFSQMRHIDGRYARFQSTQWDDVSEYAECAEDDDASVTVHAAPIISDFSACLVRVFRWTDVLFCSVGRLSLLRS